MKLNKTKAVWNVASTAAGVVAEEIARNTIDYTKQAMDIIVNQFAQSGADNIQTSGTGITNFTFGPEDFDSNWNLIKQMDFSAVPQLYVDGGNKGFLTLLLAEIIGGVAHGVVTGKYNNEHLRGAIKTGRRIGAGYGLGAILNAKAGLESMPYNISSPSLLGGPYSLADFSGISQSSSTDISPIVHQGIANLNALTYGGIATILGVELGLEVLDYVKSKRAGIKSMTADDLKKLDEKTSY